LNELRELEIVAKKAELAARNKEAARAVLLGMLLSLPDKAIPVEHTFAGLGRKGRKPTV